MIAKLTGGALVLATRALAAQVYSTPPGGDTTGYWQQRVAYVITARLDEASQRLRARGTMRYVNNSPDTLRELYFHQYLNAFRPHSLWSRQDERAGVERFQRLGEPDHAYERFTQPVRVDGRVADVSYPGSPDSTVARVSLPVPIAPGDSMLVAFEWEARPSTLPRRQGRRGRHWDFAQWYPRIAPYDRAGWQPNALQPAGEFYGEFGTYDVTLVVPSDQILAATGVPVSGDPGWSRARRAGESPVVTQAHAYRDVSAAPAVDVPAGHRAVRFVARDVHHFAWSASPDFRYEGGAFVRRVADTRWQTWDTVAVHVLYRPGDDSTWGGLRVVRRTLNALQWLESIYGPYAYPQMTVLHRIEGGGTEFPMLQMNGSPSQGLILHEGGHVYTHGILANNEWRSGWMDEGLTSYQTEWAQRLTPHERLREGIEDRFVEPTGYRRRAIAPRMSRADAIGLQQAFTDLEGGAEPMGTAAHHFRDFDTYNEMIYTRAQVMYGQLRDVLGDSLFVAFLNDYYARWALRHVDELAMRASAERVSGRDLGWFFAQWVHDTGVMDYSLERVERTIEPGAGWVTRARVRRRGEYAHPIAVGVRTTSGWTTQPLPDARAREQLVMIRTPAEPLEVRLDPHHFSWDWDRRNDVQRSRPRLGVDWPFLRQADRDRGVWLVAPVAWYGDPGGTTAGLRSRGSYMDLVDRSEWGIASTTRATPVVNAVQWWARFSNPYVPFFSRPLMGWSLAAARLDDVVRGEIGFARERTIAAWHGRYSMTLAHTDVVGDRLAPDGWSAASVTDVDLRARVRRSGTAASAASWFSDVAVVGGVAPGRPYVKAEIATGALYAITERTETRFRTYVGARGGSVPPQRALLLSSRDPLATYWNHWWRPRGAILKQDGVNWLPLGGAAVRGYRGDLEAPSVLGANVDVARTMARVRRPSALLDIRLHAFADAAKATGLLTDVPLRDAGLGVSVVGRVYDRDVRVRLDAPLFVDAPAYAVGAGSGSATRGRWAGRWVLTFDDIW